jgi:hypothetical protein
MLAAMAMALGGAVPEASAQQGPPTEPAHDTAALAKATQNPVANLISLPFQFNLNGGGDLEDGTIFNLNFQPVIPFKLTPNINVIARTIVPMNSAPGPDRTRFSGMGDIQAQLFLTRAKPGAIVLGVGPVFSLPTATSSAFETGTFAAGLGAVVVKDHGPWVLGALLSQFWPVTDAGGEPETNLLTFQPFINYNFGGGWALSFAPVISANWDAPDGEQWTVPLGAGIVKTTVFNRRPMNVGFQYYRNVERPPGSAGQTFRFVVVLLYPQAPGH